MVPVCKNSRYTGVVELNILIMDLDKMDDGVCSDQREEGRLDCC